MQNITEDTKNKLLKDEAIAIETTILVNPEPLSEISPTLPDSFPSEFIPKEKCEIQMLGLINCMVTNKYDNVPCENFQYEYYQCKKFRDSALFELVKQWECSQFKPMENSNKKFYMETLLINKAKLLDEYNTIPVTSNSIGVRRRIDSDIQQLTWRINYLPNCLL